MFHVVARVQVDLGYYSSWLVCAVDECTSSGDRPGDARSGVHALNQQAATYADVHSSATAADVEAIASITWFCCMFCDKAVYTPQQLATNFGDLREACRQDGVTSIGCIEGKQQTEAAAVVAQRLAIYEHATCCLTSTIIS